MDSKELMAELDAMGVMGDEPKPDAPKPDLDPAKKAEEERPYDDEVVIDGLRKMLDENAGTRFTGFETETLRMTLKLIEYYNAKLVYQEERRGEGIQAIHGSNEILMEYEKVIGGDLDLTTGIACLRLEEGDEPEDTMVFIKGQFLGQVRQVDTNEFRAMVKREGKIDTIPATSKQDGIRAIVRRCGDIIAGELSKVRE